MWLARYLPIVDFPEPIYPKRTNFIATNIENLMIKIRESKINSFLQDLCLINDNNDIIFAPAKVKSYSFFACLLKT